MERVFKMYSCAKITILKEEWHNFNTFNPDEKSAFRPLFRQIMNR